MVIRMGLAFGALVLGGCSGAGSPRVTAAGQAAEAFSDAVHGGTPASACTWLAPQTRQELEDTSGPCLQAIQEADLPGAGRVLEAEVYGLDAMVRMEHDTVFLALFDNGWRVTAAGCSPEEPDRPFTCEIKGE